MRNLKFLRAWRVFLYAVLLINVGSLVLDALVGTWFAILPAIMIVGLVAVTRLHAKTIARREYLDRPRPDYSLIAAMEQEVYGETFEHEGTPASAVPSRPPAAQRCSYGHLRDSDGTCEPCYRRHIRAEIAVRRSAGASYRELAEQFGMTTETVIRIARKDGYAPGNLRWERRS